MSHSAVTQSHTHPTSDADRLYSESLAHARLTALRALLEIINSTDDPVEKRHVATAILRAPDPTLRPPPRAAARSAREPHHHPPQARPHDPPHPSPRPPIYPLPRSTRDTDKLLADAEDFINDESLIDSVADLPDLPDIPELKFPTNLAAILAANAGIVPDILTHNGADPPVPRPCGSAHGSADHKGRSPRDDPGLRPLTAQAPSPCAAHQSTAHQAA